MSPTAFGRMKLTLLSFLSFTVAVAAAEPEKKLFKALNDGSMVFVQTGVEYPPIVDKLPELDGLDYVPIEKTEIIRVIIEEKSGRTVLVQEYPTRTHPPAAKGGVILDVDSPAVEEFRLHDVARRNDRVVILIQWDKNMYVDFIRQDHGKLEGHSASQRLEDFEWICRDNKYYPFKETQIVPVDKGAFILCTSRSGNHVFWDVTGEHPKLVWRSKSTNNSETDR